MTQLIVLLGLLILVVVVFIVVLRRIEHEGTVTVKEEKEKTKEKETQKESSSIRQGNGLINKIIDLVIILIFIIFLAGIGYGIIDTVKAIFLSPVPRTTQEKTEWRYCQKGKLDDEFKCDFGGNEYKVKDFIYTPEGSSFEVCWNLGCTEFKSHIGSPSMGTYHNRLSGEKGTFSGLEQTGTGFSTASVSCRKNCSVNRDLFTIYKK